MAQMWERKENRVGSWTDRRWTLTLRVRSGSDGSESEYVFTAADMRSKADLDEVVGTLQSHGYL